MGNEEYLPPSVTNKVLPPVVVSSDQYGNYNVISGSTQTIQDIQKKQVINSATQKSTKPIIDVIKEKYNKQLQERQKAKEEFNKQQEIRANKIKETKEQQTLILQTAQQEVKGSSKFEALRSQKLAELKSNIKKQTETTVNLAGGRLQLVGTVKPFIKEKFITKSGNIELEEKIPKSIGIKEIEKRLNEPSLEISNNIKQSLINKQIQQTISIKPNPLLFDTKKDILELEDSVKSGLRNSLIIKQIQQTESKDIENNKRIIEKNTSNLFIGKVGKGISNIGNALISPLEASFEFGKTLKEIRPYVLDVMYSQDIQKRKVSSQVVKGEAINFISNPKVQEGALVSSLLFAPPIVDLVVAGIFLPQQTEQFIKNPTIEKGTELAIIGGAILTPIIIKKYKKTRLESTIKETIKSNIGEPFINTNKEIYEVSYLRTYKNKFGQDKLYDVNLKEVKRPLGFDIQRTYFEPAKQRQLVLSEGFKDPFSDLLTVDIKQLPTLGKPKTNIRSLLDTPPKTFGEISKFRKTGIRPIEPVFTEVELLLIRSRKFKPVETFQSKLVDRIEIIENGILRISPEYSRFGKLKNAKELGSEFIIESEINKFSSSKSIKRLFSSKKAQVSINRFKEQSVLKPLESEIIKFKQNTFTDSTPKVLQGFSLGIKPAVFSITNIKLKEELKTKAFILNIPKDISKINIEQEIISENNNIILKDNIVPKIIVSSINISDTNIKIDEKLNTKSLIIASNDYIDNIKKLKDIKIQKEEDIIKPIVSLKLLKEKETLDKRKNIGYDTFVRSKGKDIKVNKKALPENKAFNLGFDVVDNTASATFKIKESKTKITESDDFQKRGLFKLNKKNKNTYVEKNTYRIDSLGERRGITIKGYLSKRKSIYSFF